MKPENIFNCYTFVNAINDGILNDRNDVLCDRVKLDERQCSTESLKINKMYEWLL